MVPTIVVSDAATVSPASGVSQDFTSPVTYTVTAEDLTTQDYVVSVTFTSETENNKQKGNNNNGGNVNRGNR